MALFNCSHFRKIDQVCSDFRAFFVIVWNIEHSNSLQQAKRFTFFSGVLQLVSTSDAKYDFLGIDTNYRACKKLSSVGSQEV